MKKVMTINIADVIAGTKFLVGEAELQSGILRRFSSVALLIGCAAVCVIGAQPAGGAETNTQPKIAKGPFEPAVASLTQHQTPEWFRDTKFGIYTHWGPVAVGTARQPAGQSDTWYGRYMYIPGLSGPQYHGGIPSRTTFEDHRKNFGDQAKFGFKDIIPLFKAERFNADEWADLFVKSGAKFAGTVVIHHDNFAMWDSQVTRWNAVKMGPKRDLTGELERAIHKRKMKFVAAMHHAMTWYYYEPAFAYDAKDPQYSDLYGEPHPPADKDLSKDWTEVEWAPPSERFVREWLAKCVELVDKYKVDLLWHDAAMEHIPEPVRLSMAAHFYNRAAEGKREVVLTYKGGELPQGTAVLDFERGGADNILPMPWLSDTSVGRNFWYYDAGDAGSFSITELVQILVDIVSKNGCLLLNVGPHPDGTISQKQKDTLLGIGRWLKENGEAIYGTRPWKVFGEGANPAIRFTSRGDTLYALVLAVPQGAVKIASLGKASKLADKPVAHVKLLGSKEELDWVQENDALVVNVPKNLPCEHAVAFRIDFGGDVTVYPDGRPAATLRLEAKDQGVLLKHGGGPGQCDVLGAREALIFEEKGVYHLFYDGAGPKGWLACLATSKDLKVWEKKGPILDFGKPGEPDSATAASPWVIFNGKEWHMFYLGSPNATPFPDRIPSFPYLTMKAKSGSLGGPWVKQPDVVPFRTKPGTYYGDTASPGHIVKQGKEYLMFFSASMKRTLGIARTKDLNEPWAIDPRPIVSPEEQIENSSLYFEPSNKTWFLFTNHIGLDGGEYTDAVWVYWSKDLNTWDAKNKAVVLDGKNCTWSKKCIGMPSVIAVGKRLAIFYDGPGGDSVDHMRRDVGLAWLELPLTPPAGSVKE
jgi:alpha-L-fucosidase/predicted GH43/DUF377 family glycosyl hydrolase